MNPRTPRRTPEQRIAARKARQEFGDKVNAGIRAAFQERLTKMLQAADETKVNS